MGWLIKRGQKGEIAVRNVLFRTLSDAARGLTTPPGSLADKKTVHSEELPES